MTRLLSLFLLLICCCITQVNGAPYIVHLTGSPYEMGLQHGKILKAEIEKNMERIFSLLQKNPSPTLAQFEKNLPNLISNIPPKFIEEMRGLSDGAEIPLNKILTLNLIPELFHCTGLTVKGAWTSNQALYHVRVLDYNVGEGLQETAALLVCEPKGKIPFINIGYAGFVGLVTGMNQEKISIGEIGGKGYGSWDGIPMAFLLRKIAEEAHTLDDAKAILKEAPRTCEYYYVIADGKDDESVGIYSTKNQLQFIQAGSCYAILASDKRGDPHDKKIVTPCRLTTSPWQTVLHDEQGNLEMLVHKQPDEALIIMGFTRPARYPILMERLLQNKGSIDETLLQNMIRSPVSLESNLHNVIFLPSKKKLWISHRSDKNKPASEMPYEAYSFDDLLNSGNSVERGRTSPLK